MDVLIERQGDANNYPRDALAAHVSELEHLSVNVGSIHGRDEMRNNSSG